MIQLPADASGNPAEDGQEPGPPHPPGTPTVPGPQLQPAPAPAVWSLGECTSRRKTFSFSPLSALFQINTINLFLKKCHLEYPHLTLGCLSQAPVPTHACSGWQLARAPVTRPVPHAGGTEAEPSCLVSALPRSARSRHLGSGPEDGRSLSLSAPFG